MSFLRHRCVPVLTTPSGSNNLRDERRSASERAGGAAVLHYTTHRLKITSPVCVSTVRAVCNGRGRPRPGTALPHSRIRHPLYASLNFCSGALNRRRAAMGRAVRASEPRHTRAATRRAMGHSPSKRRGKWFANRVARRWNLFLVPLGWLLFNVEGRLSGSTRNCWGNFWWTLMGICYGKIQ